jgi:hypothetical protein
MAEMHKMAVMKPQLNQESKVKGIECQGFRINAEIKHLDIHTKKVKDTSSKLELVASKYKQLVNNNGEILVEMENLCLIKSTQQKSVHKEGLARIVKNI